MLPKNSRRLSRGIASMLLLAAFAFGLAACGKSDTAPTPAVSEGKHYQMKGKVLSVAKAEGSANIDAENIPGFMDAMAMSYPIPDEKTLSGLNPGDDITADVVVTPDGKYHLENIVVTKKADGASKGPSSQDLHQPQPGEKVPDFALVNQDGKTIHLTAFKGGVTLVTFIYTQCPYPDYCPLVSKNFAQIYAATRANPKVHLVSVSFDPAHDTPKVLRQYGATFKATTGGIPFDRWQFATAKPQELAKMTNFFGVFYDPSGKEIVHSLSTAVINPDGTIYKWYEGSDWKPADLVGDADKALAKASETSPATQARIYTTKSSV